MIRVLIVDDHPILRAGLQALIDNQADMEVVAEGETTDEAVREAELTRPDVAVLDLSLPGGGGIQAMREIRERVPEVRLLALTIHDDVAYLRSVIAAGGSGYVIKQAATTELLTAIRTVHEGRSFIGLSLEGSGLTHLEDPKTSSGGRDVDLLPSLSGREQEVLVLVARGYTNRQIGEKLGISAKTVATYRTRLNDKLGLESRADLVRFAIDAGFLKP